VCTLRLAGARTSVITMREIKFRAWDKLHKEMVKCVGMRLVFERANGEAMSTLGPTTTNHIHPSYFEMMQFTGFTNNGEDWYEDDILESDGDWYQIEWCDEQGRWIAAGVNSTHQDIDLCELLGSETWLQGNIYENPELLGQSVHN
jgi:hypothetical protein